MLLSAKFKNSWNRSRFFKVFFFLEEGTYGMTNKKNAEKIQKTSRWFKVYLFNSLQDGSTSVGSAYRRIFICYKILVAPYLMFQ